MPPHGAVHPVAGPECTSHLRVFDRRGGLRGEAGPDGVGGMEKHTNTSLTNDMGHTVPSTTMEIHPYQRVSLHRCREHLKSQRHSSTWMHGAV